MKIIKLNNANEKQINEQAIKTLKNGGLVVFPTDTVYGLLADATNPKAIDKLLSFKDRPIGKAISVFVADQKMAEKYVILNQNAKNVVKNLLPGPFTIVAKAYQAHQAHQPQKTTSCKTKIDRRLMAENGTLGFRIPNYPLINKLVAEYNLPLTATSANLSGKPPVHNISSFLKTLSLKKKLLLDLIIDAGILVKNKPSTVIDTTTGQLKTLRIGELLPKTSNSLISKSEKETQKLAQFLATKFIKKSLSKPLIFLLEGDLGAGKTVFAKGLGKTLGVTEEITSPTYTIANEYKISNLPIELLKTHLENSSLSVCDTKRHSLNITNIFFQAKKFIHYDLFRLESENELKEIKFLENFSCGNIYAVEWPERIPAEIISALKNLAEIVYLKIKILPKNKREIQWNS